MSSSNREYSAKKDQSGVGMLLTEWGVGLSWESMLFTDMFTVWSQKCLYVLEVVRRLWGGDGIVEKLAGGVSQESHLGYS
eukprot:9668964-Ditylum_brightwellii.AAC.1